jgi:uncharacterized protein
MLCRRSEEGRNPRVRQEHDIKRAARLMACFAVSASAAPLRSLLKVLILALAVVLVFSGCSMLPPKRDRARFIVLATTTPGGSNGAQLTAIPNLTPVTIGLGPVKLPGYLDRAELVIRTSPNGFDLSETNRWAEPLADNFRHVLANDLSNLLDTTNIVQYPWDPETRLDYIVHIQVQRFEPDTSGNAQLTARWDLRTPQSDQVLASREAQLSRPMTSLAGDAAAAALSEDVAELAGQIASAIVQAQQQRMARRKDQSKNEE